MCQKRNSKEIPYKNQSDRFAKVDECIAEEVIKLNKGGILTLASCCGHSRYKKTIVVKIKESKARVERVSNAFIPRKIRFYQKDSNNYYYIPEIDSKEV